MVEEPARRVMVVEDEPAQLRFYRRLLSTAGHEVFAFSSALEALESVRSIRPDVILTDIQMPGMDGVVFHKKLRADPETSGTPVILMTGLSVPGSLLEAAAGGLREGAIFPKSGSPDDLLERVRRASRPPAARVRSGGKFEIDPVGSRIWIRGRRVPRLAPRRFQLLCALLRAGRVLQREDLLERVWGGAATVNLVEVTLLRLRRDLKDFPGLRIERTPEGYRLVLD